MRPTKRDSPPGPPVAPGSAALASETAAQLPLEDTRFAAELDRVLALSDYAAGVVRREAAWLAAAWNEGALERGLDPAALAAALADELADADEQRALAALRRHRHRNLLAILWRDLNGRADFAVTVAELSALAETLIDAAVRGVETELERRHGVPRDPAGQRLRPIVLGMGKLGGGELNFSSDVDLIFAYRQGGNCDGPRALSTEQYFASLVHTLVRWLSERTADGFVYRVDLRLRPFGDAGRPALSFAAMEQYYQRDGRDWERYAFVKARPVAGDRAAGAELLAALRPFVYRRYLDYAAFDALREMKAMIQSEVARRDLADDVKRGPGGIREIEFIAQTFQLVRGGPEPALRDPRLRPVLSRLAERGLLEPSTASALDRAYVFLRTLENRLQQINDRQTHRLPDDPELTHRIATAMGYPDAAALMSDLERHRAVVEGAFRDVFALPESGSGDRWAEAWGAAGDPERVGALLAEAGFRDSESGRRLCQFHQGGAYRGLGERARRRVDRLMPRLLEAAAADARPNLALRRTLAVVDKIAARTAYVALLCERPPVLERLVFLCRRSSWITDQIAHQPALLDELIGTPHAETEFARHLAARLAAAEDPEAELNALRRAQQAEMLSLAVARLGGGLDPPEVARRLSAVADQVLAAVHGMAWRDLIERHGAPPGDPGLAIIGYGTLGGRELNFDSDLDLVFLFRAGGDGAGEALTDGPRSIDVPTFYSRLSQRILHLLTTLMPAGRLYKVDTRLRPNGKSGFLVSSFPAFAAYQREQAWTWELQALSRARWVAGDSSIATPFAALRRELLCRPRDRPALAAEVAEMREKMRGQLDQSDAERFDLKHGRGGKVDVEFITQFCRLALSRDHPALAETAGTLETLAALEPTGLLAGPQIEALTAAYRAYQAIGQRCALRRRGQRVGSERVRSHADKVAEAWATLFGGAGAGR